MALPIWALFMNKVYNNGELGITREDKFIKPDGFNVNFDCVDISNISGNNQDSEVDNELGL
jgi:hypothetical protein